MVAAVEINQLPHVRTSSSMLLGMTLHKRRKRTKYNINQWKRGNFTIVSIFKNIPLSLARVCKGNPATVEGHPVLSYYFGKQSCCGRSLENCKLASCNTEGFPLIGRD